MLLQHNVIFFCPLESGFIAQRHPDVSPIMAHMENDKICSAACDYSSKLLVIFTFHLHLKKILQGFLWFFFFFFWFVSFLFYEKAKLPLSQVVCPKSTNITCKDYLSLQFNLQSWKNLDNLIPCAHFSQRVSSK